MKARTSSHPNKGEGGHYERLEGEEVSEQPPCCLICKNTNITLTTPEATLYDPLISYLTAIDKSKNNHITSHDSGAESSSCNNLPPLSRADSLEDNQKFIDERLLNINVKMCESCIYKLYQELASSNKGKLSKLDGIMENCKKGLKKQDERSQNYSLLGSLPKVNSPQNPHNQKGNNGGRIQKVLGIDSKSSIQISIRSTHPKAKQQKHFQLGIDSNYNSSCSSSQSKQHHEHQQSKQNQQNDQPSQQESDCSSRTILYNLLVLGMKQKINQNQQPLHIAKQLSCRKYCNVLSEQELKKEVHKLTAGLKLLRTSFSNKQPRNNYIRVNKRAQAPPREQNVHICHICQQQLITLILNNEMYCPDCFIEHQQSNNCFQP